LQVALAAAALTNHGTVPAPRIAMAVNTPNDGWISLPALGTPFEARPGFLEAIFHTGSLEIASEEKSRILKIMENVPTIVDIFLERPAVIPEIAQKAVGLLGSFGANDAALLDILFGRFKPQGKLPFELPSSMEAVRKQKEDLPYDSENPLYPFGYGLSYP
jgi:beta-glucosidase